MQENLKYSWRIRFYGKANPYAPCAESSKHHWIISVSLYAANQVFTGTWLRSECW